MNKNIFYLLIIFFVVMLFVYRFPLSSVNVVVNLRGACGDHFFYMFLFVAMLYLLCYGFLGRYDRFFILFFSSFFLMSSIPLFMYLLNLGIGYGFDDAIYTGLCRKYFMLGWPFKPVFLPYYHYNSVVKQVYYFMLGLPHYLLVYLLHFTGVEIQYINLLAPYLLFLFTAPYVLYRMYGWKACFFLLCVHGIFFEICRGKPYTLSLLFLILTLYFLEKKKHILMFIALFLSFISHYLVGLFLGIYVLGILLRRKWQYILYLETMVPLPFFIFLLRKLLFPELAEIGEVSFIPNPLEFIAELFGLRIIYLNNINASHTFLILGLWYILLFNRKRDWNILIPLFTIHLSQSLLGSIGWMTVQAFHRRIQTVLDILLIPIGIRFMDMVGEQLGKGCILFTYVNHIKEINLKILWILFLSSIPLLNYYYTYCYPYAYPMIPLPPYYKCDRDMVNRIEELISNNSVLIQSSPEFLCQGIAKYGLGIPPYIYDPWLRGIRTSFIDMLNCSSFNLIFSVYKYRYVVIVLEENRTRFYLQLFKINHSLNEIYENILSQYNVTYVNTYSYGYARYHLFVVKIDG